MSKCSIHSLIFLLFILKLFHRLISACIRSKILSHLAVLMRKSCGQDSCMSSKILSHHAVLMRKSWGQDSCMSSKIHSHLAVLMRKSWGQESCMSFKISILISHVERNVLFLTIGSNNREYCERNVIA